jgi:flavin reductase (DIM6/NTAB) family NADH-FMN oxidoreductase RutF
MEIDPSQQSVIDIYKTMVRLITPRPIAWVSTCSADGRTNLAPFSYFAGVGSAPPSLMISVVDHADGRPKDTTRNIQETGEFVVNIVPFSLAEPMHASGAGLDYGESEFESTGLEPVASRLVTPPGVALAPARMECRLMQIVRVGNGPMASNAIFGEIVWIYESETGECPPSGFDTIGRMGHKSYCRTTERFEL